MSDDTRYSTNTNAMGYGNPIVNHISKLLDFNNQHHRSPYATHANTGFGLDGPAPTALSSDGATTSRTSYSYHLSGFFDKNK